VIRPPTPEEIATAEIATENLSRQLHDARKNPALTVKQRQVIDEAEEALRQAEVYRKRRLTFEGAHCLAARLEAFLNRQDEKDAEADSEIRKTFSSN
jgi:hypothetical protein